ncbi:MAG: CHAT domain-containing protein, partial [bacterium]
FNLKRDYEALKKQLETDYPEYHNLKYNTKVATVPEVQAALDENTLLLEYFYGDSAIYIFALDKGGLEIVTVKKDQRLDQQIQAFRKAIIESDYALFVEKGRTLYRTLLAPVAHQLGEKHLLIIPDGPLHYLPFETLLTKDIYGSEMDFSNVPYLLKERSVSYHYSATLWLETTLRKREKEPSYDYVAFAPVNWDSTVASNAVFATLTANRALDSTRALPVNLLSTRKEVLDIEAQFNEKYNLFASLLNRLGGNKTRVFLDHEATEAAAKHYNLEDYRYIHFATHGFANTAAPTLSGLLLADQRDSTASEDGVLRLGEIYNLALNADLVILSACETGYGKLSRGEGMLSLTRGFIYAGAKNLVVSLWQVDANSPSELIPMFFKGVLKGEAKNAALRNAKLALIKSGSVYAEPKHWAPFVLIGQ